MKNFVKKECEKLFLEEIKKDFTISKKEYSYLVIEYKKEFDNKFKDFSEKHFQEYFLNNHILHTVNGINIIPIKSKHLNMLKAKLLRLQIEIQKIKEMDFVKKILENQNAELLIVGGFLRDSLGCKKPKDIDFVTNLLPEQIEKELKDFKLKYTGQDFGVIRVLSNETNYEIATYRKDFNDKKIMFASFEEDFQRRDFTVNTLYYDLRNEYLKDPTSKGIEHSIMKKFAFVGEPKKRIEEDPLRILRGYHLIKKGYSPTKDTLKALRKYFRILLEKACSENNKTERIREHIEKLVF